MELVSDQEKHWADPEWARAYISRNRLYWTNRVPFWREILSRTQVQSILEVGCNVGGNMQAIRSINRQLDIKGVDISYDACIEASLAGLDVEQVRAADVGVKWPQKFDLSATVGCLIHVGENEITDVMRSIVASSKRFVLAVEYAADETEGLDYRGHSERLWRRPFGQMYASLGLKEVATGFLGKDQGFDDCTFWLMEL